MASEGIGQAMATIKLLWCSTAFVVIAGGGEEELGGPYFVFGDSLVDAGNNNYLSTLSRANFLPNGIDFGASGGEPAGRFTNGRTIPDIIGDELGKMKYPQPFLSPNTTGKAILNGVNYGSGGGGIMNETGRIFMGRVGMDVQVDYFETTRKQLDEVLGRDGARELLEKKAIFSVTVGSNDFLNNYLLPFVSVAERASRTPSAFVDRLISALRRQLTIRLLLRLYKLGGRKFVVGNVGPIGCIPYAKWLNGMDEEDEYECAGLPNGLAQQYNRRLRALLIDLNQKLPGAHFCLANVYDIVMDIITNHKDYGFTSASAACCGGRLIPCGPASSYCEDRTKYVFRDFYHPSEAANAIIARKLIDGDAKYISPINLRQLQSL